MLEEVIRIAGEAGRIAAGRCGTGYKTWEKVPGHPVCDVDLELDAFLRARLTALDPEAGWLSEETLDDSDRIERRRIECGQPRDNLRLDGDWRRHRFGIYANLARYGEFCSFTLNPADDQEFGAKWLTDVEASFRPAGYLFALGVQNLFNVFPDRNSTINSFNGIQTFPSHSPFGMNGRGLYARVGRTF